MMGSTPRDAQEEELSAIDPRIEEAFRELTSSRALEVLLVTTPGRSCAPLLPGLAALRHHVVIARSKTQALEYFYLQAFDLVICDQGAEGSTCDEFATYLRTLDPRQRILILDFEQPPF